MKTARIWIEVQKKELYRLATNKPDTMLQVDKYSDGSIEATIRHSRGESLVGEYGSISGAKQASVREAKRRGLLA